MESHSCQQSIHHKENGNDVSTPVAPSRNVLDDRASGVDKNLEYRSADEETESDTETAVCGPMGLDGDDNGGAIMLALAKSIMDEDSDNSSGAKKKKKRNAFSKYEEKDKLDLAVSGNSLLIIPSLSFIISPYPILSYPVISITPSGEHQFS